MPEDTNADETDEQDETISIDARAPDDDPVDWDDDDADEPDDVRPHPGDDGPKTTIQDDEGDR